MALDAGTRVGSYEILSALGAGGMGEVYRATDTKLKRHVAIKILPPSLAGDPERLARFQREAEVLASLNHPNIAHVYGLEGAGGATALVMELVDGEDLAERIARGAVSLDEALPIALQIADALEAAHDQRIIHRDLKPANVKIRPDGTVKVLDFGLAKMLEPTLTFDSAASPTLTSPAITGVGVIMGTAAYMSPEQARGKLVTPQCDVWAFGCLLFEMLAGRRAFNAGDSVSDAIAAILKAEPEWSALPADTPLTVRTVLRRCLEKDLRHRLRAIGDAALMIVDAKRPAEQSPSVRRSTPSRALAIAALVLVAAAAAAIAVAVRRPTPVAAPAMHLALPLPTPIETRGQSLTRQFALSPDGTRLGYAGRAGNRTSLYVLDVTTGESKRLPDTEDAYQPTFSPDGKSVTFAAATKLRTLQLAGGLVRDIGDISEAHPDYAWDQAGGMLLADTKGLTRRHIAGGPDSTIAAVGADHSQFGSPFPLPGGAAVLVSVRAKGASSTDDASQVGAVSLVTGATRIVADRGGSPAFVADPGRSSSAGFLIYADAGRLFAAPFDVQTLSTTGPAVPVIENVEMRPNGDAAQFSVSANGTLAYREGATAQLVWVDRSGAARPLSSALRRFAMPRLSPDGRSLAVEIQDTPHQVWLLDIDRDLLVPATKNPGGSHNFAWTPGGEAIFVTSIDQGSTRLAWVKTDGSGETTTIFQDPKVNAWIERVSRDGRMLVLTSRATDEISALTLGDGQPPKVTSPLKSIATGSTSASLSPDTRWIAICNCATGTPTPQVFVKGLSDGSRVQVSTDTGDEPLWAPSGTELFFRSGTRMMAVDVTLSPTIRIGKPRTLFEGDYLNWGNGNYDVTADGQRFVMVRPTNPEMGAKALSLRLNWVQELKARVLGR